MSGNQSFCSNVTRQETQMSFSRFWHMCVQFRARPPVGPASVGGGVGLGPHVPQRFHGRAVLRSERDLPPSHQRLVQAAGPRRGRILQHPRARPGPAGTTGNPSDEKTLSACYPKRGPVHFESLTRQTRLPLSVLMCRHFSSGLARPLFHSKLLTSNKSKLRWRSRHRNLVLLLWVDLRK